jgi:hypothetical protein
MSGEGVRYQANGFIPINEPPARRQILADTDTIVKGDALHDDGNGKATNATVSFDSATFLGVAAEDCDNSGDDGLYVAYYPKDDKTQYRVPVAANAAIAQTAIGTNVDLENNDDIDISDAVTTGLGFRIDEIDISTLAIAANTYGYAIGHFAIIVTES